MPFEEKPAASPVAALTQRLAAGDEASFAEFHAAYASRIFRYLIVLQQGDEHAAAELLQDTLIRVARHTRRFDDAEALWSWLTRLARSAAADRARKSSRYLRFLDRFQHSAPETDRDADRDIEQALDAALAQMPPDDAELLRAKYHEQIPQRDLATRFAISEEALESRLRRARAALRQLAFQILRQHQQS